MEIYIVVVEDRHTDAKFYPFSFMEQAIQEGRRIAKSYCKYEYDYAEHDHGKNDGWLFYAVYSCEGDCVRVVRAELDKGI